MSYVKRRPFCLPLVVLVLIFSLLLITSGCGNTGSSDTQAEQDTQNQNQSSTPGENIKLKLAYSLPATHIIGQGISKFAQEVESKTNGQVTIEIFPNSQLYRDVDIPQSITNRSIDLGNTPIQTWNTLIPGMGGWPDVPFLFPTVESLRDGLDKNGLAELLNKEFEKKGAKVLVFAEYGPTSYSNSKRPLKSPEDFKGLKIRGRGNISQEVIKALGAAPTFISAAEQYEALQRGTVDGVSTGLQSMSSRKLYEVQKYLTITNDSMSVFPLAINLKVWNELPKDVQDVMLQVSADVNQYIRTENNKAEQQALEDLIANKMEVYTVTPEELPKWKQAVEPVYDLYLKEAGDLGQKILDIGKKSS